MTSTTDPQVRCCLGCGKTDGCECFVGPNHEGTLLPPPTKWVPVAERLPADGATVFFYVNNCPIYGSLVERGTFSDGRWYDEDQEDPTTYSAKSVSHWMPVEPWPGPPQ